MQKYNGIERRKYKRTKICLPVSVHFEDPDCVENIQVDDESEEMKWQTREW